MCQNCVVISGIIVLSGSIRAPAEVVTIENRFKI